MDDYFVRLLIRQRHAEILKEVRAARLSRLNRPAMNARKKGMMRMFRSFHLKLKKSAGPCVASPGGRQPA